MLISKSQNLYAYIKQDNVRGSRSRVERNWLTCQTYLTNLKDIENLSSYICLKIQMVTKIPQIKLYAKKF